ncbi:MAG: hypothetical protein ACYTE6_07535 [Planctomycetota bacterium]
MTIGNGGQARQSGIIAFWDRLSRKLDTIAEPYDRAAVEAMVASRVPRPDN